MLVGSSASFVVLLHQVKGLAVYDRFVRVPEYENIFGIILQPFLQLVGLGIGFEVDGISRIFLIGKHCLDHRSGSL